MTDLTAAMELSRELEDVGIRGFFSQASWEVTTI
jgi:hypothetical protein